MPGYRSQYRIVSLSGIADGNFVPLEDYISLSLNKESVDLGGVAAFKSPKLLSQHGVEGIRAIMVMITSKCTLTRMGDERALRLKNLTEIGRAHV